MAHPKIAPESLSRKGVELLSPLRPSSFEEGWYDIAEPDHFWLQWRLQVLLNALEDAGLSVDAPLRALDIGGGRGVLRTQLETRSSWTVDMADLDAGALLGCVPGRGRTLYYDALDRNASLVGSYDAVFLFDVLEHIAETKGFLRAALDHVKPGGRLFINVPALASCFSPFDRV
ncbi:MAG: class I SAM-dependent methyltransferase, partial [Elusimicrobiota bacterium]